MESKVHDQEIILQKLWKSRKLFNAKLETASGKPVEVLYAGSENNDSGPDFKNAILKIAGVLLKGDLEVHLNSRGWYEHRHHLDAAYNNVILHLVSEFPARELHIEREDGVRVEQLHVHLDKESIDLWSRRDPIQDDAAGLCLVKACPLREQSAEHIMKTVERAAELRFLDRVEQIREDLSLVNWDEVLYRRIMQALGYSKNQQPFRRLAELVPFAMLASEMQWVADETAAKRCAALLFGASGLLPGVASLQEGLAPDSAAYVAPIIQLWSELSRRLELKPMRKEDWQFFRLRPQNFPTRRIAGFVQVMRRFYQPGLLEGLMVIVRAHQDNIKALRQELEKAFCERPTDYWSNHYTFDGETGGAQNEMLIGRERARDILVNTVTPVLYLFAQESCQGRLKNVVLELGASYPKQAENEITRLMRKQLSSLEFRMDDNVKTARQQQGLIQLHRMYCRSLKCEECLALPNGFR